MRKSKILIKDCLIQDYVIQCYPMDHGTIVNAYTWYLVLSVKQVLMSLFKTILSTFVLNCVGKLFSKQWHSKRRKLVDHTFFPKSSQIRFCQIPLFCFQIMISSLEKRLACALVLVNLFLKTTTLAALTSELVLDVIEACFEACCISVHFTEAQTNETDTWSWEYVARKMVLWN